MTNVDEKQNLRVEFIKNFTFETIDFIKNLYEDHKDEFDMQELHSLVANSLCNVILNHIKLNSKKDNSASFHINIHNFVKTLIEYSNLELRGELEKEFDICHSKSHN